MILKDQQIIEFIKTPASRKKLEDGVTLSEKLNTHVNAVGVNSYIQTISNFENNEQRDLREKTAISNKHIFHNIIRIINKIFSAKGGSVYYELPQVQANDFIKKLSDIKGIPLRKWIQNKGLNKYVVDPNGVFLMENKMVEGRPTCYPTYKSSKSIHDYQVTGRKLEYLIMKVSETTEGEVFYRVYDDAYDRLVKYGKDVIETIEFDKLGNKQTFKNIWDEVPGFLIGDKHHDVLDIYDSRFNIAMELADKYLRTNSVKNVYEFAHGFPLMWRMLTAKCAKCNGTGMIDGKVHVECKGTGYQLRKDVSDIVGVFPPKTADEPKLVPDIAGYVQPDLETWREFRTELDWLESILQFAILGSYTRNRTGTETATGVWVDVQPVNDSLNDYADWVEETEKFMTDFLGKFYYGTLYKGASINLGRRYMIERPDDLLKKYSDGRTMGSPTEKLDDDMVEYYESKYMNDAKTLDIQLKLFFANPYRHISITDAKSALPNSQYLIRVYYDFWLCQVKTEQVSGWTYDKTREDFLNFAKSKITENGTEEEQPPGTGGRATAIQ